MTTSERHADHGGRDVAVARRRHRRRSRPRSISPSASTENPKQLRQLPDDDGERQPVEVADLGRFGEQVGDEAELGDPGHRS